MTIVIDDLLHGAAWADAQRLQLDLHHWHAVDQQDHVVAMVAVFGVDAQLVDHLEGVLAPVAGVDQRVVQRRAVVARKAGGFAQPLRSREDIGGNDVVQQTLVLVRGEVDAIECLELLQEVAFQCGTVADVRAQGALELAQLGDQVLLNGAFLDLHELSRIGCAKQPSWEVLGGN